MPDTTIFDPIDANLFPDPERVVIRPFGPDGASDFASDGPRARRILARIVALSDEAAEQLAKTLLDPLRARRHDPVDFLRDRCRLLRERFALPDIDEARAMLAVAYFSQEFAFESAALFNPSIILHPDQNGLASGELRLLISLRGVGEGHVSSVTFRIARWTPGGAFIVEPTSSKCLTPTLDTQDDACVRFSWPEATDPSEAILFPATPSQRQGIEDLRLVRFIEDDGTIRLFGTYTAFNGSATRPEMLEITGPGRFEMRPLKGEYARNKGMALFPRRIDGRYVMLGRIDNENLWLMHSDDPFRWDEAVRLLEPSEPWEFTQIGNCGSPIELDEGWLVLTHGVGMGRTYSIGAVLLDKTDPTTVLARSRRPLLSPSPAERGGYVPNVVYSCGALLANRTLLLPYAVGDRFTALATASVDRILAALD